MKYNLETQKLIILNDKDNLSSIINILILFILVTVSLIIQFLIVIFFQVLVIYEFIIISICH